MKYKISEDLVNRAVEFHGHLGPFLILGLKAGLYAINMLGRDPFKMKVKVECEGKPPTSCFIDGIQYSTGCTYGKRNIELVESKNLTVTFTLNNEKLEMKLKDQILTNLKNLKSDLAEKEALKLIDKPIEELFEITHTK